MESRLRELLGDAATRFRVPGAQLGVSRGADRTVVTHGTRREGSDLPVVASTRFHAGSLAKVLASQMLLEAAGRGELDLDLPCSAQAPVEWDDTPRTLMSQTSGRPNELPGEEESLDDFVARVAALGRVHPPGRFSYGNAGWSVLDRVLDARTGAGFADRVAAQFGGHVGLPDAPAEGHAVTADGTVTSVPPTFAPAAAAAGALWWATADELLDLADLHLHPERHGVAPAVVDVMRTPAAPLPGATVADAWGYGWMLWDRPVVGPPPGGHHRAFGWAGFTGGHRAYLRCFPDQDAAVVLLANAAGPLFGPPGGSAAFDALLPDVLDLLGVPPLPAPNLAAPRFAPPSLPGQYGPLTVRDDGAGPVLDGRALGGAEHRLAPASGDTWVVEGAPPGSIPLAFSADEGATVPAFLYLGPFALPRVG